ncbi:MAG: ATP-binding cassette domain-containing protein [Candidatus Marinimicrobia bacterium]|nr:ATP-binding cassette domain-containing protein [Candidatus Neomarinimicrobiota bacterium]MEC9307300.1 ATP-binding cassette domain-containing protein [Candidatus Neomarinimicrobiota bacterium]
MLKLANISKQYDGVRAVDQVSFAVQKGDIYGFLGPNGAGKTTTIRMIMGIIQPDSGSIEISDNNMENLGRQIIGYLPEDRGLYQKQKLGEIIVYFGLLRGLEKTAAKAKAAEWLERFGLGDQQKRKVEELSKGNQQKVQFILSLVHDPTLLILDEPFTGLDPLNQLLLKEIIQEKRKAGTTILFSTHQMEQVERLCNNICLINQGRIIVEGALESIQAAHQSNAVEVVFTGELNKEIAQVYFNEVVITESKIAGILKDDSSSFLRWINDQVSVESFQVKTPSLEQIFIEEVRAAS